jgi:sulfopyruvate decarboxylase subunit alpha
LSSDSHRSIVGHATSTDKVTSRQFAGVSRPADVAWALDGTGFTFVTGVPDSVFADLIAALEASDLDARYLLATREDNAIALAVGAYLAGEQPLVFMESAGVGTALDALTSLAVAYGIPLVLLIAWAGYKGRDVVHHNAIGEGLDQLLDVIGVPFWTCAQSSLAGASFRDLLDKARRAAVDHRGPTAVLVVPTELARAKELRT